MRSGQTAHIHTKLRKGCDYGFIAVFSAVGDVEPSPYVPVHKTQILRDGKPSFVTPTTIRLTRQLRPIYETSLVADEDCTLYLYQELDTALDTHAIGRIVPHATGIKALFVHAVRWIYRNTRW